MRGVKDELIDGLLTAGPHDRSGACQCGVHVKCFRGGEVLDFEGINFVSGDVKYLVEEPLGFGDGGGGYRVVRLVFRNGVHYEVFLLSG